MNKKSTMQASRACPGVGTGVKHGPGMHAELAICKRREREHVNVSSLLFFFYKKTQAFEKKGTIKSNCISLYIYEAILAVCDVMTNINK